MIRTRKPTILQTKGSAFQKCTASFKKWDLVKDQVDFVLLIQINTLSYTGSLVLFVATLLRGMDCKGAIKIFTIESKRTCVNFLTKNNTAPAGMSK